MTEFQIIDECLKHIEYSKKLQIILKDFTGNKHLIDRCIEEKISEYNNKVVNNINIIRNKFASE